MEDAADPKSSNSNSSSSLMPSDSAIADEEDCRSEFLHKNVEYTFNTIKQI